MLPPSMFPFLLLPFEIRQQIYTNMLSGQIIHICPDSKQGHHFHHMKSNAYQKISRLHDGGTPGNFYDDIMYCSRNHYQSLASPVKWTYNTRSGNSNLPSPTDVLSLLLSCRAIYHELEPLIWKHTTFCIGLPQFSSFHKHFLSQERANHPIPTPRGRLLQRISISLVQENLLSSSMGRDIRYHHLDCHELVESAIHQSIKLLTQQCTGLQDLTVLVDGATLGDIASGGLVLDLCDSHALLQFRRLKSFKLLTSGHINYSNTHDRVTYGFSPPNHPMRLALDAAEAVMADIVTRTTEPPPDVPPEGVSATDSDYVWLKDYYERHYGSHPRLVELALRTKVWLQKRGVVVPSIAHGGLP